MAPERVRRLLDYLAAGLNPKQAAPVAGVSKTFAYVFTTRWAECTDPLEYVQRPLPGP